MVNKRWIVGGGTKGRIDFLLFLSLHGKMTHVISFINPKSKAEIKLLSSCDEGNNMPLIPIIFYKIVIFVISYVAPTWLLR